MRQPKHVNVPIFYQLVQDLGFRINQHDASLVLRSLTGGKLTIPFTQFCRSIIQDQSMNWQEMTTHNGLKLDDAKFCTDLHNNKCLRPEYRDDRLHQQQNNAATHFGSQHLQNRGIEALIQQQLNERTKNKHQMLLLVQKLFNPVYDASTGHRMVRASTFAQGIRRLGVMATTAELKQTIRQYSILLNRNGVGETKLIDMDLVLKKGIARPDISRSPAAAITKKKVQKRTALPNRGIPDDSGIRRIATPNLKALILKKIDERSKPGGGMCLEAFRMFNPGSKGAITPRYFNRKLRDYGLIVNQNRSDQLLMEVDVDGGGDVSFNEFAEHFIPKGVQKGSLTDKLASGGKGGRGSAHPALTKQYIRAKNNMTLATADRDYIQKNYPDAIDAQMNQRKEPPAHKPEERRVAAAAVTADATRQQQPHQKTQQDRYGRGAADDWVTVASPLRHIPSTFRSNQSFASSYDSHAKSLHSLLEKPLRSSPILKKAGRVRRSEDEFDETKPWWAKNRQPSRLNWRRLRVEKAAGTISGSYSQCSLRKGAEKYY